MPRYFFILGKNPTLSTAEIISVLNKQGVYFEISTLSGEVLAISTEGELQAVDLMHILGGTIKIGKVLDDVSFDDDEQKFEKIFEAENLIKNYLSQTTGKLHFGISIYDGGADKNYISKIVNQLKNLNITIKENLGEKELKAGFVRIKERSLSSVSVWKNKLMSAGMEMVLILTKDGIVAGKTLAVQEFESFSFRDYGRPMRDKRAGIIPPKLARMMINLAQIPKNAVLLDPFCGSGTILQEAILLGHRKMFGADISRKAVTDSMANIDWLFNNYKNLNASDYNIDIYQTDVRSISAKFAPESINAIVTEPFLGPPLFKIPDIRMIQNIISEVSPLYIAAFTSFSKILEKGGKVIFLFPVFEIMGEMHFVPILDKIEKIGFKQVDLLPADVRKNPVMNLTQRNTVLYGSREHFVKREIIIWQKT